MMDDEINDDATNNEATDMTEGGAKHAAKPDKKAKKNKEIQALETRVADLTADLQRTRADFENYRKRGESERAAAIENGKASATLKLLPVIDNIERAIRHMPEELKDNLWAQSVAGLVKNLEKSLDSLGLTRIESGEGTAFDPELHEAISFDEDADGEHEVIAEELQAGYAMNGRPIRHAMVRVTRQ